MKYPCQTTNPTLLEAPLLFPTPSSDLGFTFLKQDLGFTFLGEGKECLKSIEEKEEEGPR